MIDEQKIIGMLQAKALGCLDDDDDKQADTDDDGNDDNCSVINDWIPVFQTRDEKYVLWIAADIGLDTSISRFILGK